jgi:primosomal protein N' (replication factor Y)
LFLLRVIPATKIPLPAPQILTYFSAQELLPGSLVSVPVHNRKATGVVLECEKINGQKMALRKAEFELRGISKIISAEPVVADKQIQLAKWISEYYYCPLGSILKLMLPAKLTITTKLKTNKLANQKLILAPEISFIDKIAKDNKIKDYTTLHSEQTNKQYDENWLKIKSGEKIIIATRMALFASFQNLKEIIIEDEHNDLYKSRQTPRYHAREAALKLAKIWNAKIIFKSNTPSVETSWLAENKKISLKVSSFTFSPAGGPPAGWQVPSFLVDLRNELKEKNFSIFSRLLQEKIKTTLAEKQQIILFINRRGSSTSLLCRDCGFVPRCPNCDVPFVYHLSPVQFRCHHCGHSELPPILCPQCLGTRIKYFGTGTQKVETEFKKLFPNIPVARFDSDTTKIADAGKEIIEDFNNKKIQVLIGTQIIFNKITQKAPLVALMLADTLLYIPDFRSNEKTFQIINHLKNLAGKDFILQTYSPENKAIQYAVKNDYKSFYQEEIATRHTLGYPPFSQLIKLSFQHKNAKKAEQEAKILTEKLKQQINNQIKTTKLTTNQLITILGPSPAFISKIKNKYIWQIILKSKIADLKLRNQIFQIIPPDWTIDIDPLQII